MEDELIEGALKGLLRLASIVVRFLFLLIWEFFFVEIGWYIGWPVCRALSIGKLPRESITESENASKMIHSIVSLVGVLFVIGLANLLAPWE